MQVLEGACARDAAFAAAAARGETEWKLKIQENLDLKRAVQWSLSDDSQAGAVDVAQCAPDLGLANSELWSAWLQKS